LNLVHGVHNGVYRVERPVYEGKEMTKVSADMSTTERLNALLTALRDGSYMQAAGALRRLKIDNKTPRGFCCEGVACDLTAGLLGEWETTWDGDSMFLGNTSYAPRQVSDFFGIDMETPYTGGVAKWAIREPVHNAEGDTVLYFRAVYLASLNDNGMSLPDIADKIEAYYLHGGKELYEAWVKENAEEQL